MNVKRCFSAKTTLVTAGMYCLLWWVFAYFIPVELNCLGMPAWFFFSCFCLPCLLVLALIFLPTHLKTSDVDG